MCGNADKPSVQHQIHSEICWYLRFHKIMSFWPSSARLSLFVLSSLFKVSERKELLTDHLCSIIEQVGYHHLHHHQHVHHHHHHHHPITILVILWRSSSCSSWLNCRMSSERRRGWRSWWWNCSLIPQTATWRQTWCVFLLCHNYYHFVFIIIIIVSSLIIIIFLDTLVHQTKIPSEMEVAPRYKLLTLLTWFTHSCKKHKN